MVLRLNGYFPRAGSTGNHTGTDGAVSKSPPPTLAVKALLRDADQNRKATRLVRSGGVWPANSLQGRDCRPPERGVPGRPTSPRDGLRGHVEMGVRPHGEHRKSPPRGLGWIVAGNSCSAGYQPGKYRALPVCHAPRPSNLGVTEPRRQYHVGWLMLQNRRTTHPAVL